MKSGDAVGRWKLLRRLGKGGNGEVWCGEDADGTRAAVKVLRGGRKEPAERFAREVTYQVQLTAEGFVGIVPVIDTSSAGDRPPWMAMPIAQPFLDALGKAPSVDTALQAIADIAAILARLHRRGIAHRDVKPENLFWYDNRWCVGDLGLIQIPDAEHLTTGLKALGPRHYLAPEMLNEPALSDGCSADVYSLAKTLWVILTGQTFPMPGPHRVDEAAVSLRGWIQHPRVNELDLLLERATVFDPQVRLNMADLEAELRACLEPSPESLPKPNLDAIAQRINAITEPGRRAAQQELEIRQSVNAAFRRLEEEVVSPVYHALARRLTGFRSTLSSSDLALVDLPRSLEGWFELGSAGILSSTQTTSAAAAAVAVAVAVRGFRDGTMSLVAILFVEPLRGFGSERRYIWREVKTVPAGSAQAALAIDNMAVDIHQHVPSALAAVAEILTERPADL